jgi:uroporphyrinogen-III synthase
MPFGGLRVIALESRRRDAMEELIVRHGGQPFVAPAVKETPIERHEEVHRWAERLFAGDFDLVVLTTGAGVTYLRDIVGEKLIEALRRVTLVSRGPKPAETLQELGLPGAIVAGEPGSWHEIVDVIAARPERRIGIQEHGRENPQLVAALEALGAEVSTISIYQWTLPDDSGPLREAARRIAERECDVVLFTTSIQLTHLLDAAGDRAGEVLEGLRNDMVVGSVGPVMTAALADYGITPQVVPAQPKMQMLVRDALCGARMPHKKVS